ncbi:hypothetical protein [Nitrosomonas eutropha]|uniref:hypothetical protein n=1 Tax=Nitrosomonas eutropha TaxID=916 RepID=UPI001A92CA50|nr:hypothetical protein [Nitrosomonas eutropha]
MQIAKFCSGPSIEKTTRYDDSKFLYFKQYGLHREMCGVRTILSVNLLARVSTISARFTSSHSLIPSMIELLSATHKGSYIRNIILPSLLRSKHTKTDLPIATPRDIGCISLKNTDPDACKV